MEACVHAACMHACTTTACAFVRHASCTTHYGNRRGTGVGGSRTHSTCCGGTHNPTSARARRRQRLQGRAQFKVEPPYVPRPPWKTRARPGRHALNLPSNTWEAGTPSAPAPSSPPSAKPSRSPTTPLYPTPPPHLARRLACSGENPAIDGSAAGGGGAAGRGSMAVRGENACAAGPLGPCCCCCCWGWARPLGAANIAPVPPFMLAAGSAPPGEVPAGP